MLLATFFACAGPDLDSFSREPLDPSTASRTASRTSSRLLPVTTTTAGFVELRAYTLADDGSVEWVGRSMVIRDVTDTTNLLLPAVPPTRDRQMADELTYALALRADADGEPGGYLGISPTRIVWTDEGPPGSNGPGWFILGDSGLEVLATGAEVDANVYGYDAMTLSGTSGIALPDGSTLQVVDDGGTTAFDGLVTDAWRAELDGPPPTQAFQSHRGFISAEFGVLVFDANGDEIGEACAEAAPVRATWRPMAENLGKAIQLEQIGQRGGWDLLAEGSSWTPVAYRELDALHLEEACN